MDNRKNLRPQKANSFVDHCLRLLPPVKPSDVPKKKEGSLMGQKQDALLDRLLVALDHALASDSNVSNGYRGERKEKKKE